MLVPNSNNKSTLYVTHCKEFSGNHKKNIKISSHSTRSIWGDFNGNEAKNWNGLLKKMEIFKITNSQIFFAEISQIGPWVREIAWCEVCWCSLTYIALKQAKNAFFVFFGCFTAYAHYIIWNQNVTSSKFHKVNSSYLGCSQFLRVPQKRFNVKSNP